MSSHADVLNILKEQDEPETSWEIAKQLSESKDRQDIKKKDSLLRGVLKNFYERGIIEKKEEEGVNKFFLKDPKVVCDDGEILISADGFLIATGCPYKHECKERGSQQFVECKASKHLSEWIQNLRHDLDEIQKRHQPKKEVEDENT